MECNVKFKTFPKGKFPYLLFLHKDETLSLKDLPIANLTFRWIKMKSKRNIDTKVTFHVTELFFIFRTTKNS